MKTGVMTDKKKTQLCHHRKRNTFKNIQNCNNISQQ